VRAHKVLVEYIMQQARDLPLEVEIRLRLLPDCPVIGMTVRYCEGQPWPRKNVAWCPTGRAGCSPHGTSEDAPLQGARLRPDTSLKVSRWSLLEVLERGGVTPALQGLPTPWHYAGRLGGWVNRLHKMRARLRCRMCNEPLVPEWQFAVRNAVYNTTVFGNHLCGHGGRVYLSHCWSCGSMIDSRDCRVRHEGWYVCMACGSAEESSTSFSPGDICPKCGAKGMSSSDADERKTCSGCQHQIRSPHARRR
jgi:hypothetical protein